MPRNKLYSFVALLLLVCLTACSDNSLSIDGEEPSKTIKVAFIAKGFEMPRYKRVAQWALDNINTAQFGFDNRIKLNLEFKNQDDSDIEKYMESVASDSSYAAVIGPTSSELANRMAKLLQEGSKPMISPRAGNVEYQRTFAQMPNLWNLAENDIAQMEAFFSHIASSTFLTKALKLSLLTPSDEMEGGLVNSYTDWFGFLAEEYGLNVDKIYLYKNESELREHVRDIVNDSNFFRVLLFDPYNAQTAIDFDDELHHFDKKITSKEYYLPQIYCTSNFVYDSVVSKLNYDFYDGFDLYARPESGFAQAYREHFDEDMIHGEAQIFDAIYILAYAAIYAAATGTPLNESIEAVVDGEDGQGGDWMVAGAKKNIELLQSQKTPYITGVSSTWSFKEKDNSVQGSVYRRWNILQGKFVTVDFSGSLESKHVMDPTDIWWNHSAIKLDTTFFNDSDSITYSKVGKRWAVLIAGSSGWGNYRYEADVFAMYQRLKKQGYDDDHIVLIVEDDIAHNSYNKEPGVIKTSLNGKNVYDSSAIDYRLSALSIVDLGNILKGNKSSRLSQVIKAEPEDNIFLFWSGHGTQGAIDFGDTDIDYNQMAEILKDTPHRKMMFVLETCYSGGMGEQGEGIPGIIYLTASSPYESSRAITKDDNLGVYLTNSFTQGFLEIIDNNPDTSLRNVFLELASKISGSHVHLYNLQHYGSIYTEFMSEFF